MGIRLYHQVGHNPSWNIESFKGNCGDGLIFSPVHQQKEKIEELDAELKSRAVFDPQYYLPNSQKRKLLTYPFFPETLSGSGGFKTQDFPLIALESAKFCVGFQVEQGFEKIVIPARFINEMVSDYIDRQEEYTVRPFLEALQSVGTDKPVFLSLPITSAMVEDKGFRTKLLNWVTGFPEISGLYILVNNERATKQIQSPSFLEAYLDLLVELTRVDLALIVGHTNTESLLFSLIDDAVLTFGSFENTRMFSIDKFIESDEDRRGPKARIYLPGLLNWILFGHAAEIRRDAPKIWDRIYVSTDYAEEAFGLKVEPYFNQPQLYKHHFECFYGQMTELSKLDVTNRYTKLKDWFQQAIANHNEVKNLPLDLDVHGNGAHVEVWLDVLNRFYRKYLKA
jgi:hypothetical protein